VQVDDPGALAGDVTDDAGTTPPVVGRADADVVHGVFGNGQSEHARGGAVADEGTVRVGQKRRACAGEGGQRAAGIDVHALVQPGKPPAAQLSDRQAGGQPLGRGERARGVEGEWLGHQPSLAA
jgi:hypothetical protein